MGPRSRRRWFPHKGTDRKPRPPLFPDSEEGAGGRFAQRSGSCSAGPDEIVASEGRLSGAICARTAGEELAEVIGHLLEPVGHGLLTGLQRGLTLVHAGERVVQPVEAVHQLPHAGRRDRSGVLAQHALQGLAERHAGVFQRELPGALHVVHRLVVEPRADGAPAEPGIDEQPFADHRGASRRVPRRVRIESSSDRTWRVCGPRGPPPLAGLALSSRARLDTPGPWAGPRGDRHEGFALQIHNQTRRGGGAQRRGMDAAARGAAALTATDVRAVPSAAVTTPLAGTLGHDPPRRDPTAQPARDTSARPRS